MRRAALPVALAAALFAAYVATGARDVSYWDTGEMAYVPYTLGIAHPSGFPLYVLLGWLWSHLVAVGGVAFRMSLFSAFAMTVAALGAGRIARSAWAIVLFGFAGIVWLDATRPEVHALFVAFAVWTLAYALAWHDGNRVRDLLCCALLWGCAFAVHPLALALMPSLIVLFIARLHDVRTRDVVIAAALAMAVAAIPFTYMAIVDVKLRTLYGWAAYLGAMDPRVSYSGLTAAAAARLLVVEVARYALVPLACAGAWIEWRGHRARTLAIALFGVVPAFVGTHFDEADPSRYFLCAAVTLACFGAAALRAPARSMRVAASLLAGAYIVAALVAFPQALARAADERARRETDALVRATPDRAIIVASWTLAPTLLYRTRIEGSLGHRRVVPGWIGEVADDLPAMLQHAPVFVSGPPEGAVPGYALTRVPAETELYRVDANR